MARFVAVKTQKSPTPVSLLEQAKAIVRPPQVQVSEDERELALAWLRDEVTLTQAAKAMNASGGSVLYRFAVCLREEFRAGRLKVAA